MAEEKKGRIGYMTESALAAPKVRGGSGHPVLTSPQGSYTEPVWITPLREGEPQPGETWEWRSGQVIRDGSTWGKVYIETPPYDWNVDERAVTVLCEDGDYCVALLSDLRQPPKTRTVTVELTERDIRDIRDVCYDETCARVARKLAEALEDS